MIRCEIILKSKKKKKKVKIVQKPLKTAVT